MNSTAAMKADRLAATSAWMSAVVWAFQKAEWKEPNSVAERGPLSADEKAVRKVPSRAGTMDAPWAGAMDSRSVGRTALRWAVVKGEHSAVGSVDNLVLWTVVRMVTLKVDQSGSRMVARLDFD